MFIGVDGHDFIYDRPNECPVLSKFDWILCNNTIVKNKEIPQTICTKTDFLPKYVELLENLVVGTGFALITCSSKFSPAYRFPEESARILANPYLHAWFSENNTGIITNDFLSGNDNRHKFHAIPSGLNFHDRRKKTVAENIIQRLYSENGGLNNIIEMKLRGDNQKIMYLGEPAAAASESSSQPEYYKSFCGITRNLSADFYSWMEECSRNNQTVFTKYTFIDESDKTLEDYYSKLLNARFLFCPCDYTIDIFPRIWEALALGAIPIMLKNPFVEKIYKGFPIYFVDSWSETISPSPIFYKCTYQNLMEGKNWAEMLCADFWLNKIQATIAMPPLYVPAFPKPELPAKIPLWGEEEEEPGGADGVAFSFCIYGKNKMYYLGLRENIIQIKKYFNKMSYPRILDKIYIFIGSSFDRDLLAEALYDQKIGGPFTDIKLYFTGHDGVINMIYRYAPASYDEPRFSHIFVRDADSFIGERDMRCIFDFLRTGGGAVGTRPPAAHVIRDHYYHKSKLTGGLTGLTQYGASHIKTILREKIAGFVAGDYSVYGDDETFLNTTLYDILHAAGEIVVHSNLCEYPGETRRPILCRNTLTNFCGNVLQKDPIEHFQFSYNTIDIHSHYKWCRDNGAPPVLFIQTIISLNVWRDFTVADFWGGGGWGGGEFSAELLYGGLMQLPYSARSKAVVYLIECFLDMGRTDNAMMCYGFFAYCEVDEVAKTTLFRRILKGRNIVCMTEGCWRAENWPAEENTIYIIYGNFEDDWRAYPADTVIYRNVWFYEKDKTELFAGLNGEWRELDGWSYVGAIYIMGLTTAPDRIYQTMVELARAGVNLEKVHIYRAVKDGTLKDAYLGATKNHLDCLEMARGGGGTLATLFLEDDFVFSHAETAANTLMQFFREIPTYTYDVCFLAASKMHERAKWGGGGGGAAVAAMDILETRQYCTTSSAYLVPNISLDRVYEIVKEGYDKLEKTGDSTTYCIDRYWTKLQNLGRMILFKEKLGFQRPAVSKITGTLNMMLD